MDTAAEIEEREDNDGNSAFYNTRTQVWGWTREEVEENIEERMTPRTCSLNAGPAPGVTGLGS